MCRGDGEVAVCVPCPRGCKRPSLGPRYFWVLWEPGAVLEPARCGCGRCEACLRTRVLEALHDRFGPDDVWTGREVFDAALKVATVFGFDGLATASEGGSGVSMTFSKLDFFSTKLTLTA